LGLQAGGSTYPGKFTLIVHTTHAVSTAGGSTEQLVLSNSVEQPVYRVMLWYNNPFHFLTGWVEASISNGMPSQSQKKTGGEHPMWLVTARSPMVSGRDSFTGSGLIDGFFDYWLPVFVHEMRYDTQISRFQKSSPEAAIYAAEKYQEVQSQDIISPGLAKIGLGTYDRKSALDEMRKVAQDEGVDRAQKVVREVMRLGNTRIGKLLYRFTQEDAKDLHEP